MKKDIPGWELYYEACEEGFIYSKVFTTHYMRRNGKSQYTRKYKKLSPAPNYGGYLCLNLHGGGRKQHAKVHRLIAMAFHQDSYFPGAVVNHKNSDRSDNRAENLEWVTQRQNHLHSIEKGRSVDWIGVNNISSKLDANKVLMIREKLAKGEHYQKIADEFEVHNSIIYLIKNRKAWKHV